MNIFSGKLETWKAGAEIHGEIDGWQDGWDLSVGVCKNFVKRRFLLYFTLCSINTLRIMSIMKITFEIL